MSYALLRQEYRCAAKVHRCNQCETPIVKGGLYCHIAGVYDGAIQTDKQHVDCRSASVEYARAHSLYDEDWPWLWDCVTSDEIPWFASRYPNVAKRLSDLNPERKP